jgi:hypothetical protein
MADGRHANATANLRRRGCIRPRSLLDRTGRHVGNHTIKIEWCSASWDVTPFDWLPASRMKPVGPWSARGLALRLECGNAVGKVRDQHSQF